MNAEQIGQLASEEEFRLIDSLFLSSSTGTRTVVFTSPERHSGCTRTLGRAALKLAAHTKRSVCIVDANLRWPALHTIFPHWCIRCNHAFGAIDDRGLLQALSIQEPIAKFVRRTEVSNLWVLGAGGSVMDTHSLLISDAMNYRLAELSREFNFVLVDTPATRCAIDSNLIARRTDGAVFVLAANETRQNTAEKAKAEFEAANIPILGSVLNKRTYPIPDALYRYL
jgi:protein-tyrosine kinase